MQKYIVIILATLGLLSLGVVQVFGQNASGSNKTAIVGQLAKVSDTSLSIKEKSGTTTDVTLASTTKLLGQPQIGFLAAAIVDQSASQSASTSGIKKAATKVYVKEATSTARATNRVLVGILTGINGAQLTLLEEGATEKFYTIGVATGSALIKTKDNPSADMSSLELGQRIGVVGLLDQDNTMFARLIQVIAQKP